MVKHVVHFSGGGGSWAAARRVADEFGTDNMTLLFADTNMEDADLYRFRDDAAKDIGAKLVCIGDGRTPWQVFRDERFMGNSRVDPCSRILKRELLDRWCRENCDPKATVCYVGIDWSESHRFAGRVGKPGLRDRMAAKGWTFMAPLCDRPYLSKEGVLGLMLERGIEPPRLYAMGFPHNNCGGFCVKAGMAHFRLLLRVMPERYAYHEQQEQELREYLGKDVTVLRERAGGQSKPLTLREFRERIEQQGTLAICDESEEWGGCGCAID